MKLTINERLVLLQILPKESNFVTLKIIRDLEGELALSEKEIKDWDVETINTVDSMNYKWNVEKATEKDVKIGEKAADVISEALITLDKQNKLTNNHFTLYEKFIETKT